MFHSVTPCSLNSNRKSVNKTYLGPKSHDYELSTLGYFGSLGKTLNLHPKPYTLTLNPEPETFTKPKAERRKRHRSPAPPKNSRIPQINLGFYRLQKRLYMGPYYKRDRKRGLYFLTTTHMVLYVYTQGHVGYTAL